MPGMMDTILNVGLTPGAVAWEDPELTAQLRARLRTMFRSTVGSDIPDDPWDQLRRAVEAVFRSWNSDRARSYRRRESISDDLGTAVTIQAMVFGNRGPDSATGVAFSRNPATGAAELYGDVLFDAQGEDVVAGTHATDSIAVLDERLPAVAGELRAAAARLERHYADLCDIEFTIERGRLWILQVRVGKRSPQAALRIAVDMAEDPGFPLSRHEAVKRVASLLSDPPRVVTSRSSLLVPLTTGLGASPGIASGEIAVTPDAAVEAADAGRDVILVRSETSPEDVHGMARARGILTARGGLASHAAVVARGWGIPAVVGAAAVEVTDKIVTIGARRMSLAEPISIDGSSGEVFAGAIPGSSEVVPEAGILRSWAADLGVALGQAAETDATRNAPEAEKPTIDDVVRTIGTKGFATAASAGDALIAPSEVLQPLIEQLATEGLITTSAGAFRLTDAGRKRAADLLRADRDAWGEGPANEALEAFLALDRRMKEIVTAWQMKPPDGGGEAGINDHADAAYDDAVLGRLEGLHADAAAWLMPIETACPRLRRYRPRLARALAQSIAGNPNFVASPRVDSYHGAWFELHEDLIGLAGRTREEEAAAGRA
jgi:pyruvate,orthophosphate dikinase